jgi:oxidoreductase
LFLYAQTKGRVEVAVTPLGFDRLHIYRPSFLTGIDRPELKIGEKVVHCIVYPITRMFPTAMSVPVQTVAKAMTVVATTEKQDEGKVARFSKTEPFVSLEMAFMAR